MYIKNNINYFLIGICISCDIINSPYEKWRLISYFLPDTSCVLITPETALKKCEYWWGSDRYSEFDSADVLKTFAFRPTPLLTHCPSGHYRGFARLAAISSIAFSQPFTPSRRKRFYMIVFLYSKKKKKYPPSSLRLHFKVKYCTCLWRKQNLIYFPRVRNMSVCVYEGHYKNWGGGVGEEPRLVLLKIWFGPAADRCYDRSVSVIKNARNAAVHVAWQPAPVVRLRQPKIYKNSIIVAKKDSILWWKLKF